jgi:hypothetical protein
MRLRPLLRWPVFLAAVSLLLIAGTGRAAAPPAADPDPVLKGTILEKIPHDASFFAAALRNKEQLDALRKSNAFKALKKSPVYKLVLDVVKRQLEDQGLPADLIDRLFDDRPGKKEDNEEKSANEELIELLLASLGDEVFVYGGRGWTELALLFRQAVGSGLSGGAEELGNGDVFGAMKALSKDSLQVLQKNRDKLRVPELVIGMRAKDPKKIEEHVKRLEKELAPLLAVFDPRLKGKLTRDGGLLTLTLDGSFLPWNQLELGDLVDKKDFADLFDHLKKATLAVSFGIKGDYVVLAVGSSPKDLDRLGKGKPLARRYELQPIAKQDAKKVTAVAYVSKDFLNATLGAPDWEGVGKTVKSLVDKITDKDDARKAVKKDVDGFVSELKKWSRGYGAVSFYAVRTADGYDAFVHDFGDHSWCKGVKTHLFDHVRGEPIFAAAFGFSDPGPAYATLSKYVRAFYGHAESALLAWDIDEEYKTEYKKHAPGILKAARSLDDAISKKLLPAMKGRAGAGVVVDGKWKSKRWHSSLPESKHELPMLEPALLLGISDPEKFAGGMKDSRTALVDLYNGLRGATAQMVQLPDLNLQEPKKLESKKGDLYVWPDAFKKAGLDEQVQLTAGVGKRVAVLSLSKEYAEALMAPTKLQLKDGPLVMHRDKLVGGMVLNFPALIDVLMAWTDVAADLIPGGGGEAGKLVKKQAAQIAKQVREASVFFKSLRQVQSATYLDGDRLTTHVRVTLKDAEASPEPPKKK